MTVPSTSPAISYTGNSSQNNYSFSFPVFIATDLVVTVQSPTNMIYTLTLNIDFTVAGLSPAGAPALPGSITLVNASQAWLTGGNLTTGYIITISRIVILGQTSSIRTQGDLDRNFLENCVDRLAMQIEQLNLALANAVSQIATGSPIVPVPIASGGTNSGATLANGKVMVSSGGKIVESAIGSSILTDVYDVVAQGGADPTGAVDCTTIIQNAINSLAATEGTVYFPIGTYKISAALKMAVGVNLLGQYSNGGGGSTVINQTASTPVILMVNTSQTSYEPQRLRIQGLNLNGGTNGIYAQNGGLSVTLRDVLFSNSAECLLLRGFCQAWFLEDVEMSGGTYGIRLEAAGLKTDGVTLGTPVLFDKNHFYSLYIHGQSINGISVQLPSGSGTLNTITDLVLNSIGQSGAILGGALKAFQIIGVNCEAIGSSAPTFAQTTCTTTATSPTVTLASASNFVNGQQVIIANAGTPGGYDWTPTILSGGGTTTLTMTTNAPTSVSGADIVNNPYVGIAIGNTGSTPEAILLQCVSIQQNNLGYAVTATDSGGITIIDCINSRPIYDPTSTIYVLGPGFAITRPSTDPIGTTINGLQAQMNAGTSNQFTNLSNARFTITPGTWLITGMIGFQVNGATITGCDAAVSIYSGNTTTDHSEGLNQMPAAIPGSSSNDSGATIANWIKTVSTPTTIYLKARVVYSAGTPEFQGTMMALKIAN